MSNLSTLPKGDSAWLLRKAIERIMEQVSVLETNIGSSTTGNSANTQIIFNDAGTLRGDTGLTYNKTTDVLSFGAGICYGDLTVATSTLKVNSTNNRVGIGTASPGNALHVQASGDIARFTNGTLSAYLAIDSSGYTLFTGAGQTGNGLYAKAATNAVQLWTNGAQRYDIDSTGVATWSVAGTTAMTLNANGLGIGVTPSAWGTYKGLQVGYASLAGYAGADTFLGSNVYFDGAFRYIAAGLASSYRQLAGSHQWSTAVAGVNPGDTLTVLPLATLDASGNFSPIGNVVMANTKGIDFSAKTPDGSGTVGSEVLNDYEEGTFLPTVIGTTTAGTASYSRRLGRYTKVGNLVTIQIYLAWSAGAGGLGNLAFIGLPFNIANNANEYATATIGFLDSVALTASNIPTIIGAANSTMLEMWQFPVGGGVSSQVPYDADGSIILTSTYVAV